MKTRKPKEPVKFESLWQCYTCVNTPTTHAEIMEHVKNFHGINLKGVKVQRSLIQALDGSDWYSNTYEYTIPNGDKEIKLLNTKSGLWEKNYPMRFGG